MVHYSHMEERVSIPVNEIRLVYVRSSGAGGQNVNKTSTKAQLFWSVHASRVFNEKQKAMIRHALRTRINNDGEVVLQASDERQQSRNRETAIERLERLVTKALTPVKRRLATKPTRASKERRLHQKQLHSRTKLLRSRVDD